MYPHMQMVGIMKPSTSAGPASQRKEEDTTLQEFLPLPCVRMYGRHMLY